MKMTKYVAALAAATVLSSFAGAASADTYSFPINVFGNLETGGFSHSTGSAVINDQAQFVLPTAGLLSSTVNTILLAGTANITFTKVFLDIDDALHNFVISTSATGVDTASFHGNDGFAVSSGNHTIFVQGNLIGPGGTYEGSVNVLGAAVPEPATWGMMIVGMGMVGAGLRLRKRRVSLQTA
jgi:hypothetical protein